jgi:hypothetical protein
VQVGILSTKVCRAIDDRVRKFQKLTKASKPGKFELRRSADRPSFGKGTEENRRHHDTSDIQSRAIGLLMPERASEAIAALISVGIQF